MRENYVLTMRCEACGASVAGGSVSGELLDDGHPERVAQLLADALARAVESRRDFHHAGCPWGKP
jgi:hypothetical protein